MAEKRLYTCFVTGDVMVVAESESEAKREALRAISDIMCETPLDVFAAEAHTLDDVPAEWRAAIPYGGKDGWTCEQIVQGAAPDCSACPSASGECSTSCAFTPDLRPAMRAVLTEDEQIDEARRRG